MTCDELLIEISDRVARIRRPHPVRVGIDGVDAAGKTTLGDELAERMRAQGRAVIRASIDDFITRPASATVEGDYRLKAITSTRLTSRS